MIAMTTSSSISVNPLRRWAIFIHLAWRACLKNLRRPVPDSGRGPCWCSSPL